MKLPSFRPLENLKYALETEAQVNGVRTKKHVNKIDDLLGASPVVESQQWETQRLSGPDMKILEDNFNWDDEEEESNEIGCEEK
ncbi:hypothetical protein AB4K20DRAFT_1954043 [Rhizopus microsporus]